MESKIIRDDKSFLELKDSWEMLQKPADQITIYSSFQFLYSWWINNGKEGENNLCIVCVKEKGLIIGIAPLMISRRRLLFGKYNSLQFLGRGDFLNFIISENVNSQAVIKFFFDTINSQIAWDKLELTHIVENSCLIKYLLKSEVYASKTKHLVENPFINLASDITFTDYKKNFFKKNINYYKNKLHKQFDVILEIIYGDDGNVLENISKVHIRRNSDPKRKSLFEQASTFEFLKDMYSNKEQTLTFILKTTKNEIISYATCYLFNGVLHNWNTAYELKFKDFSAGDLIYLEMTNYAFENKSKVKRIDLGAGKYPWKFRLTDTFVSTYKLDMNNPKSRRYRSLLIHDKIVGVAKALFR